MKPLTIAAVVGVVVLVIAGLAAYQVVDNGQPAGEQSSSDVELQEVPSGPSEQTGGFVGIVPSVTPSSAATLPGSSGNTEPAGEEREDGVVISVTDTAFVPSTVTVPAGTTVTFRNDGQGLHWPASDVHPTHELLKGFDAKKGLATGETYSYTFTEPGTWTMHDHLQPSITGSIVVQ